jgi:hypothetical protein
MRTSFTSWPCLIDYSDPANLNKTVPISDPANPKPIPISKTTVPAKPRMSQTKTASNQSVIPLKTSESASIPTPNFQKQTKTFAQALSNFCDIPNSQLPQPILKGDNFSISIPEEDYVEGMKECMYNLHARIIWPKGSTPLTVFVLKKKLTTMWKDLDLWGITSLGKGYYELTFSKLEDAKRVRSSASWNLSPGILKLFTWTKDFSPSMQSSTSAQVWVRIHGLAQEYWRPKILFAIASSVGTPICTDSASTKPRIERTFGHFARVLVDMDVSQVPRYKVLVERKDYAFFVEFEFENMPGFCSYCKKVGHFVNECKHANKTVEERNVENLMKGKQGSNVEYVMRKDGRKEQGNQQVDTTLAEGANLQQQNPHVQILNGTDTDKEKEKSAQGNRFDALLCNDENQEENYRQEMRNKDIQLENEITAELEASHDNNSDDEELNSQGSEFVDATQHNEDVTEEDDDIHEDPDQNAAFDNVNLMVDQEKRQELDKMNRVFLNQSWANVVDDEVEIIKDIEARDTGHMVEPANKEDFQLVQRSKKKGTQKKNPSVLNNYTTRAKSSNPKPFR